jgi:hypothetical protein
MIKALDCDLLVSDFYIKPGPDLHPFLATLLFPLFHEVHIVSFPERRHSREMRFLFTSGLPCNDESGSPQ